MAAQAGEAVNESSERQGTINEEPNRSIFYDAQEMWKIDQATREAEARQEGFIEGYIKGYIKGYIVGYLEKLVSGIIEGKISKYNDLNHDIVIFMDKRGTEIELIVNITGFSPEEVRDIIKKNDIYTEILTRLIE